MAGHPSSRLRLSVDVAALVLVALAGPAVAQSELEGGDAPAQLLSLIGLAATPDITASRINVRPNGTTGSQRIDSLRLGNDLVVPVLGHELYLEGNVGFARADLDLRLPLDVLQDINVDAIGAFGAVGPNVHVGRFLRVRPLLILGLGYVADDFGLPEPLANEPNEVDVDLRQWATAIGFGLGLDYERPLGPDLIDLRFKVSQVFLNSLWSADDRFAGDTSNQTINSSAVYKHDTGIRLGPYPLLVTGLIGANAFLGDQSDALGFSWFAEYGGGLELDLRPWDAAVQRARVRVTGIVGDGVSGISIGVGIGF